MTEDTAAEGAVISLTAERLRRGTPVRCYSVVFRHDENGRSFTVRDVQNTQKDRLAVARDLAAAAELLKHEMGC